MRNFKFGQKVRRSGSQEVFLVLGTEANGRIQMARFNHKTSEAAHKLVPA